MKFWKIPFFLSIITLLVVRSASFPDFEPPQFVFRGDLRPPSEIFKNGMKSFGDNENLVDHVSGNSCNSGKLKNTAFVATSAQESVALDFAAGLLWNSKNTEVYVNTIRATENFYGVKASLIKAFKETSNSVYISLVKDFGNEQEWIAHRSIPRELFVVVSVYERGNSQRIALERAESNPSYVSEKTTGNAHAFPTKGVTSSDGVSLLAGVSANPVSACFASCSPEKQARRSTTASGGSCRIRQMVYTTSLSADKGTFWDPIKRSRVEGLLPWKEVTKNQGSHRIEKPENCIIDAGNANTIRSPVLKITCSKNRFYNRFRVYLKGGITGKMISFQAKGDGVVGRPWTKSSRQIRLISEMTSLEDKDYRINEVFAGEDGKWWSEVSIYPVYPVHKF